MGAGRYVQAKFFSQVCDLSNQGKILSIYMPFPVLEGLRPTQRNSPESRLSEFGKSLEKIS